MFPLKISIGKLIYLPILFLALLGILFFFDNFVEAKTIYVDDDGGKEYIKIQEAVDNASNGDSVFVYNGNYNENIFINKSISLIGESNEKTIITSTDDDFRSKVIYGNSCNIKINNFLIENGSYGIYLENSNNSIIENNVIRNSTNGIEFFYCNFCTVQNNYGIQRDYFIVVDSSTNNKIINNSCYKGDVGISIRNSQENNISYNIINSPDLICLSLSRSNNNFIYFNNFNNSPSWGISIYRSKDNEIINNIISNCYIGISLTECGNNKIQNNKFINISGEDIKIEKSTWWSRNGEILILLFSVIISIFGYILIIYLIISYIRYINQKKSRIVNYLDSQEKNQYKKKKKNLIS